MLRTVYLHGEAAELFGLSFRVDVDSLGEAIRALGHQIEGFAAYVRAKDWQCVRGKSREEGMELDENMIGFRLGKADLHIMPVLQGSGGGGRGSSIGKIIAGVLLAGVAFFMAPALSAVAFGGITYGNLVTVGLGIALSGVSQLLSAQPKDDKDDDKESGVFSGSAQVARQGIPVPLVYGTAVLYDPPLISAGIHTEDVAP